jgi:Helix-turn-helix domain
MAAAWKGSIHGGTELLMLLAIADFADDEGNAYPSIGTLAKKCRMKQRNVNYLIKTLQESGELEIRIGQGPRGTNRYRINVHRLAMQSIAGLQQGAGVQRIAHPPAKRCTTPLQPVADKPSVNHQEPSEVALPKAKKGSRLSPSWQPSPEDLAYCREKRPDLDPVETAESFRDYWIAQAGSKAVKADWPATWRTWVRNQRVKPAFTKAQATGQAWEGAQ